MKNSNLTAIFALLVLMAFAVPVTVTAQAANVSVYTAGSYKEGDKNIACYWKNGVRQTLDLTGITSDSYVRGITVSGNSVYVAGRYYNGNKSIACYWKDGVRQQLDLSGVTDKSYASAITVSGNSVYVAGYFVDLSSGSWREIPCYWKDGIRQNLDITGINIGRSNSDAYYAEPNAITVSGSSVYIAGWYSYPGIPCVWKDGKLLYNLDRQGRSGSLYPGAITVYGNSVYVAGDDADHTFTCYWKDGVRNNLNGNFVQAIFVTDNSVYVVGSYYNGNGKGIGCYWKDGIRQDLEGIFPRAITVVGTSVYAAGYFNNQGYHQCYWKDGVLYDLGVMSGSTSGGESTFILVE